uniref:Uncharacterized protein n=1 Tax=Lotus japonicus TaxID=34305 RepID=I3S9F2_LOTJA|nr:unknown [Lotus japonicus]
MVSNAGKRVELHFVLVMDFISRGVKCEIPTIPHLG